MVDLRALAARVPAPAQERVARGVFGLPPSARRAIAGRPVRADGQQLDTDMQLLLRLFAAQGADGLTGGPPAAARARMAESARMVGGHPAGPVAVTTELAGGVGARLYAPTGLPEGSPLLVYYHGGGWVVGDLDTHDGTCRYLALHAGVRVLSVDYRLAPEHPFPAAVEDAVAAYRYARENAAALGADPRSVAVGGDSAGGNLAVVTALLADPDFVLALYPATAPASRTRSRDLFANGFLLTDADMDYFADHYCPAGERDDVRFAPWLADDLSAMPPTHIVTGGFDPLRDDGEAFASRLADAGVPVVLRRQPDLIHGFCNLLGAGPRPAQALSEAAGVLRAGLSFQ